MKKWLADNLVYIAFLQAALAMAGSLYFSEMLKLLPCLLCWYQRICMYPLVAVLLVGIVRKDRAIPFYALPLSVTGLAIGTYHNLLYYHLIPESYAPCTAAVSCTTHLITLLGFLTIPLASLIANRQMPVKRL